MLTLITHSLKSFVSFTAVAQKTKNALPGICNDAA